MHSHKLCAFYIESSQFLNELWQMDTFELTHWKRPWPDTRKDWRQEEKGTTEDEMVGWHHWLDGHEFEQAPGVGDGQRSLACCSPWGHKESDTTEWLTDVIFWQSRCKHILHSRGPLLPFSVKPKTRVCNWIAQFWGQLCPWNSPGQHRQRQLCYKRGGRRTTTCPQHAGNA